MHDELFYDRWILLLLMRYAGWFIPKRRFLRWCGNTLRREMAGQPWDMGNAAKMLEASFNKWEVLAHKSAAPQV